MLRSHLTYANVMATVAVFIALGSGAYAAGTLGKNTVGSPQIKKGAVHNSDLASNAVTSPKVKDGSLKAVDFAAGQLPAGPVGPQGPQGLQGIQGVKGDPGATAVVARVSVQTGITTGTQSTDTAFCNTGERLVGGGAAFVDGSNLYDFPATLHGSVPLGANGNPVTNGAAPSGWRASATNNTGATRNFKVVALCASP